jgi:hypothetical protein
MEYKLVGLGPNPEPPPLPGFVITTFSPQSLLCVAAWHVIGDRTTTRHLSHAGSPVQPVSRSAVTLPPRQFCHWPVVLSARQGLSPARWHPPGPTRIFRQLQFKHGATVADVRPPLPDQVKRGGRWISACSNKFVDFLKRPSCRCGMCLLQDMS